MNYQSFYLKVFRFFLEVKFSIYLNRRVFVISSLFVCLLLQICCFAIMCSLISYICSAQYCASFLLTSLDTFIYITKTSIQIY